VGACLVLAFLPLLGWHAQVLWDRAHFQFFPLLLPAATFLGWLRLRNLGPLFPGNPWRSKVLWTGSWGLLAVAVLISSPWLAAVAALCTLATLAYTLGGLTLTRALLPAWLLLWLAIPLPLGFDERLIHLLQDGTTRFSSRVLDVFGLYHLRAGNTIEVGGEALLVDEACGGIQSFYAMLACLLFYVLWSRCAFWPGLILLLFGLGWALFANLLRVVAVIVLTTRCGWDATTGWRHEILGWLSFALCLLLTWNTRHLFLFLIPRRLAARWFPADAEAALASSPGAARSPGLPRFPEWRNTVLAGWPILAAYGTLAVWQLMLLAATPLLAPAATPQQVSWAIREQLSHLGEETLPAKQGPWERQRFRFVERDRNDQWGRYSCCWDYRAKDVQAVASLDCPFVAWHELTNCYRLTGWEVMEQDVYSSDAVEEEPALVRTRLSRPVRRHGYLWFSLYDSEGRILSPSQTSPENERWSRSRSIFTLSRTWQQGSLASPVGRGPVFQVQVFVQHPAPLTAEELQQAQLLFDKVRALLSPPNLLEKP